MAFTDHSPEMANNIFLLAPNVDTPTSFRSSSDRVRKVWKSICRNRGMKTELLRQYIDDWMLIESSSVPLKTS